MGRPRADTLSGLGARPCSWGQGETGPLTHRPAALGKSFKYKVPDSGLKDSVPTVTAWQAVSRSPCANVPKRLVAPQRPTGRPAASRKRQEAEAEGKNGAEPSALGGPAETREGD